MLNTRKLREYQGKFTGKTITEFIDFIEADQAKNHKAGVVSLKSRETRQNLDELKKAQEETKPITPEEDFKNLK